jgi:hypothetical protein
LKLLAATTGTIMRLSTDSEHRILQRENLRPVPLWPSLSPKNDKIFVNA